MSKMDGPSIFTKWTQLRKIGGGSFGDVYKARREGITDETWFAVKVAKKAGKQNELLLQEIDIHSRLTHVDIVRYVNSFEIRICGGSSIVQVPTGMGACVALVLELLPGKNVEQMIKVEGHLSETLVRRLAKQMTSALSYLKEQGIVHADIKPANILTDGEKNFKLADFGLATEVGKESIGKLGTPYYMTPEMLSQSKAPYVSVHEMDIWALGVTIFFAFHGELPWLTKGSLHDLIKEVNSGHLHRQGMADEPEDLTEFIAGCLAKDPAQRFTPLDCMESAFLTNPKRKSPEGMSEEVRFASDLTEFGEGSRDEFYYWLARKYATQPGMPLVRFNELYDSLTVKLSE